MINDKNHLISVKQKEIKIPKFNNFIQKIFRVLDAQIHKIFMKIKMNNMNLFQTVMMILKQVGHKINLLECKVK